MDPVSVGALVSALVAGAAGKVGEDVTDESGGALSRLVGWLRARFSDRVGGGELAALAGVEEVPDSPSRRQLLAEVIDAEMANDGSFADELRSRLTELERAGFELQVVTQTLIGSQSSQVANVKDSTIRISYGNPPPSGQ